MCLATRSDVRYRSGTLLGWGAFALLAFFALETVFALFRETILVRQLGQPATRLIGIVQAELMLALFAWLFFRRLGPALTSAAVRAVALEWLLLGTLLEGLIGRFFRGLSWQQIAAGYHPASGGDSLIVAGSLFFVPLLVGLAVLKLT